jgi:hypothetical protein
MKATPTKKRKSFLNLFTGETSFLIKNPHSDQTAVWMIGYRLRIEQRFYDAVRHK